LSHLSLRLQNLRGQLRRMGLAEIARFLSGRAKKSLKLLKRKWLWKRNEFQLEYNKALGKELPKDLQRNHKAIQHALRSYVPKPYSGELTLFRAATQPKGIVEDPYLGWRGLAEQGIRLFESPGVHGAMTVDPYASALAERLAPFVTAKSVPAM